jgi:TonB-linked SusC/RagA family outer membrane protein
MMKFYKKHVFIFTLFWLLPITNVMGQNLQVRDTARVDTVRNIPVGYGIMRTKDNLTGAVSTVRARDLSKSSSVINPENALYGRLRGLMVLQNGGTPPTNPAFFVRGTSTFGISTPLIIVDGFEGNLPSFTLRSIKSISVLKDAAALAKFGQRGANGVILVKTKRGHAGKLHINASYNMGITKPVDLPHFLDAPQYSRAYNEALINDGQNPRYGPADLKAFDSGKSPYLYPNVNWFDQTLRSHGTRSNLYATFNGGNKHVRFFSLLNYVSDYGIFGPVSQHSDYSTQLKFSRLNVRTNIDANITNSTLLKFDVVANIVENNNPGGKPPAQIFNAIYSTPSAAYPVKTPDGTFGGNNIYGNNPVALTTAEGYGQPNSRNLYLRGVLRQDFSKYVNGLSAAVSVRYTGYSLFNENHTKSFLYETFQPVRNQAGNISDTLTTTYGQKTNLGFGSSFGAERRFTDLQAQVNYKKTFNHSSINAVALFHQSARVYNGVNNVTRRQNFMGNVHYGFDDRYFFGATASYSGNNHLQQGRRFVFFPAVSAGWLISNENFLQDSNILTRLKLNASWGIAGNDQLLNPTTQPWVHAFRQSQGYFFEPANNSSPGFDEASLPTPEFTFERSHKTNVGINIAFLGKLYLSGDLFRDRRTDILTSSGGRYSQVLGISAPLRSDGIVKNKGFEASLQWKGNSGHVAYEIGGHMTLTRNKIVNEDEQPRVYDYLRRTGRQIGQQFGLQAIGFFKNQPDIENSPEQQFSQVQPGDIKYKDQNGDGLITSLDEVPLGYATGYPEMYFSASFGVQYKGFSVSALFQGTGDYTAYLNTESVFWPLRNQKTISRYYYDHRWTPKTASTARFPRLTTQSDDNNFRKNSIWLVNKSYIKLRTVNVSYTLPASLTKSISINRIKVFAQGLNLISFDHIPVLDPEQLSAEYPLLRSYNFGFKVGF